MEDLHPSVILGVLILAGLYAGSAHYSGRKIRTVQVLSFAGALMVMLFALCGPLDDLEDSRLFAAHMLQHLLLCLVMPPLLLLGMTDWMLRPLMLARGIRPVARLVLSPIIAFFIYNLALALLHAPRVYDLMCRNDDFHIAAHIILMASGVIMWWPLLSALPELPRLSYPAQMLYLFAMLIPMAAVAAPIALSQTVIYQWYLEGPHPFGISPLADQVAGGLMMWVGAGFYEICVASVIFYRWSRWEDRDEPPVGVPTMPPVVRLSRVR